MTPLIKDLAGRRFGRLVVLGIANRINNRVAWNCLCDCGNTKVVASRHLTGGNTGSCGCIRSEMGAGHLKRWSRENGSPRRGEYGESNKRRLYNAYKRGALKRGLEFSLTENEFYFLTNSNCYFCGTEPSSIAKSKGTYGQYIYNGIDRLDSKDGYVAGNCVACCWMCNRAKLDSGVDEFEMWLDKIARHRANRKLTER